MKKAIKVGILAIMIFIGSIVLASAESVSQNIQTHFNSINIEVNGSRVVTENILYNGTTYAPVRAVAEMFGKDVGWNSETKTAIIEDQQEEESVEESTKEDEAVEEPDGKVGSVEEVEIEELAGSVEEEAVEDSERRIDVYFNLIGIEVNGSPVEVDNFLYNGTTYAPLRAVAEILGKEVEWKPNTRIADIYDVESRIVCVSDPGQEVQSETKLLSISFPEGSELGEYRFEDEEEWNEYEEPVLVNRNIKVFARAFDIENQLLDEDEIQLAGIIPLAIDSYSPKHYTQDYYPKYSYLSICFNEGISSINDSLLITIKDKEGDSIHINSIEMAGSNKDNVLFLVEDNLKLNTEYILEAPSDIFESASGKLYAEEIYLPFKTAHTVFKGHAYTNHTDGTITITLTGADGDVYNSNVSRDGGFCMTNIEVGSYMVKISCSDGYTYETSVDIEAGEINRTEIVCR